MNRRVTSASDPFLISASDALVLLLKDSPPVAIDVRSEGEYQKGSVPGFSNQPILGNSERHQVGLTYKREGQEVAVRLGYDLVGPVKDERVRGWLQLAASPARNSVPLVSCWRGGMRSQIACAWMREAGSETLRVQGGYKALRNLLLPMLDQVPPLWVVSGMTGSGKTELIQGVRVPKVDLEGLAHHRGSSFGRRLDNWQPAQASFENQLAMSLASPREGGGSRILVEDESIFIGALRLPKSLKESMKRAPVIFLETTDEERLVRLHRDYVIAPVTEAGDKEPVLRSLLDSLERVRPKLGGQEADRIRKAIQDAFAREVSELVSDPEPHRDWIVGLLHSYYDKLYLYSFEHSNSERPVVFRGGFEACRQWIESRPSV